MKSRDKILFAPNGNGAVFQSMVVSGLFNSLLNWGVEYLHITGVDNILNKFADPSFVGLCSKKQAEVVCKYAPKKHALERVGVFAYVENKPYVIEYSLIGDEMAKSTNEHGQLLYNHSNLLNFMVRLDFLQREILNPKSLLLLNEKYNVAVKDVQNFDQNTQDSVNCKAAKFEIFIHEFLTYCKPEKFVLMSCNRDQVGFI